MMGIVHSIVPKPLFFVFSSETQKNDLRPRYTHSEVIFHSLLKGKNKFKMHLHVCNKLLESRQLGSTEHEKCVSFISTSVSTIKQLSALECVHLISMDRTEEMNQRWFPSQRGRSLKATPTNAIITDQTFPQKFTLPSFFKPLKLTQINNNTTKWLIIYIPKC